MTSFVSGESTIDSSDIRDFFLSGSATSVGRSSISSIPWAEDAVKQNQLEWERIERVFYGEEPVQPGETKLNAEINEWNAKFPHLRIVGKAVFAQTQIYEKQDKKNILGPSKEEPIGSRKTPKQESSADEKLFGQLISPNCKAETDESATLIVRQYPPRKASFLDDKLGHQLERCLRVTSGHLLSRRHYDDKFLECGRIKHKAPKTATVLNNSRRAHDSIHPLRIRHLDTSLSPRSLPPIIPLNRAPLELKSIKEHKVIRSSLTLPSISVYDANFQNAVVGRAISALYPKRKDF